MMGIKGLVSSGSACTSSLGPAVCALGVEEDIAHFAALGSAASRPNRKSAPRWRSWCATSTAARDEPALGNGQEGIDIKSIEWALTERFLGECHGLQRKADRSLRESATSGRSTKFRDVGTGLVGAPACGDVMKLQIKVGPDGLIETPSSRPSAAVRRASSRSYRMGEGQDHRRSQPSRTPTRQAPGAAASEDPLLGAGRGCDQGGVSTIAPRPRRRTNQEAASSSEA